MLEMTSYYKNKTILITGGSGYIGSSLVRCLSKIPCKIISLTRENSQSSFPLKGRAKISLYKADIRKKKIWQDLLRKIDIFFHFAAQTSSRIANQNPRLDVQINLLPIVNIIETCQKNNFSPDIIFAGTVTQVGLTKSYPVNEEFKDKPITVYDIDKLAAEKYLQYYSNQLGKRAVTLRLANIYGPGPRAGSTDRGILNLFIRKALKGEPLTIYGKGNFVRDYIYIDDVVDAFLIAGAKMEVLNGNYYVIGSGVGHTFTQMTRLVARRVGKKTGEKVKILNVAPPEDLSPIESRNFVADTTKFRKATSWKAKTSLVGGINQTIDFYLKQE